MEHEQCILITLTGTDEQGDAVSLSTRGQLMDAPGGWVIRYEETSPADGATAETLVFCEGSRITVTRAANMIGTIVFEEGETFLSEYTTPVGRFTLRVLATEVSIRRRGSMGHIRVAYQISLSTALSSGGEMAMRHLDMRFTPCKN